MTIGKFYQKAVRELKIANIKTAELDAKVLLKFVLENDESFLLMHPEMPLTNFQFSKLKKLLNKRLNNEPIAYLTGHKEFFGHDFFVNKNVLIPRPESEKLVELAFQRIQNTELRIQHSNSELRTPKFNVLDLGTGSGCIIVSLILELQKQLSNRAIGQLHFFASDISKKALYVAKRNAKKLLDGLTDQPFNRLTFFHSDLFSNRLLHKKYDLIIANLPYVPKTRIQNSEFRIQPDIKFEPQNAIFADDNGATIIKKFLTEAKKYLNTGGAILLELDPRNAIDIQKFADKNYPDAKIELKKDLAGLRRYLIIQN